MEYHKADITTNYLLLLLLGKKLKFYIKVKKNMSKPDLI